MNAISSFGHAAAPQAWLQIFLGLSALTMASALPQWQWATRPVRPVSVWFPVGGLVGLATGSIMVGIMQPELLAALFGEF
jgi:hypothetical protein